MSTGSVVHEKVEIKIDISGSGVDTWYSWKVKTNNCELRGTANSFNSCLRQIRRDLRKFRNLAEDIKNHEL